MSHRLTRRSFIGTSAGALITATSCSSEEQAADVSQTESPWVKDSNGFILHPTNLETRLDHLRGLLTPNEQFFVRNHAPTPLIAAETYQLRIEGDAINQPMTLTYDDLLRLPTATNLAYLECAGNWRKFFQEVTGQVASGGQWETGAVGCAMWTGVQLGHVLELAGVLDNAVDVNLFGMDGGEFNRPMSLATALDSDTLLAMSMNGSPMPPDHGFPVRGVVPRWPGSNSVKWLNRIVVSSTRQWVKNNTTSYVLVGDQWPADRHSPADGMPIAALNVKSALALPRPAALHAAVQTIRGYAYSPEGPIRRVEWQADDAGWQPARIVEPVLPRAWQRFEFTWNATTGTHRLRTRATDARGNMQPETVPFNAKGYLMNAILSYSIEVT